MAKAALDEAVWRFGNDEGQSDDIILSTVSSSTAVDCLQQEEDLELSQFHFSNPHISWRVKLQVESGDVLRVVLTEMTAEDMACLRLQGTIYITRRGAPACSDQDAVLISEDAEENADEHAAAATDDDDDRVEVLSPVGVQLSPPRSPAGRHPLKGPRGPIVVMTDGPATIASIHRDTVSDIRVTMVTFYYYPRPCRDVVADDRHRDRAQQDEDAAQQKGEADVDLQMLGRMSADFGHLLATQDAADVVLQVDSMAVKAHKAVLVARSAVFRQMLQDQQGQQQQPQPQEGASSPGDSSHVALQRLQLSDVPHDAFLQVLHFMYTAGVGGLLAGRETDVLVLASRFGLDDLADECCRRMLSALDRDNSMALDLLAFAERHDVLPLKERALLVVVEHLEEVTSSTRWQEYKQTMPALATDLLETAARVLVLRRL